MLSNLIATATFIFGTLGLASSPGVPAKLEQTLSAYFGKGCKLRHADCKLSTTDLQNIKNAGIRVRYPESLEIWAVMEGESVKGYAFVDNVKGKVRKITYAVVFNTQGEIQGIEILRYRESHGGEVEQEMFRKQFAGKSASDPITVGRDIRNITGATISCRSVTGGVNALAGLFQYLQDNGKLPK